MHTCRAVCVHTRASVYIQTNDSPPVPDHVMETREGKGSLLLLLQATPFYLLTYNLFYLFLFFLHKRVPTVPDPESLRLQDPAIIF